MINIMIPHTHVRILLIHMTLSISYGEKLVVCSVATLVTARKSRRLEQNRFSL